MSRQFQENDRLSKNILESRNNQMTSIFFLSGNFMTFLWIINPFFSNFYNFFNENSDDNEA